MNRSNVMVLGAGIVGTSIALQLAKRGINTVLVDNQFPGRGTSFGNAGVVNDSVLLHHAFPDISSLWKIALKRATAANYHLSFLPKLVPWLQAFQKASTGQKRVETALAMRPLFERATAEHMTLLGEKADNHIRRNGWIHGYRHERSFEANADERNLARELGVPYEVHDVESLAGVEPCLKPVFKKAVLWPKVAHVLNPLRLTEVYASLFEAYGGKFVIADAGQLRRPGTDWLLRAKDGEQITAEQIVVALGPWSSDFLKGLGIILPLAVKRGYHCHFKSGGVVQLGRPVVDDDVGYCMTPMRKGIRVATGVEFADRDARPTPRQMEAVIPQAREVIDLGQRLDQTPWMGSRPVFPDSLPIIGKAPKLRNAWLAIGHGHWGLTLGPVTGLLLAQMIKGKTPFCDPSPFRAERFF